MKNRNMGKPNRAGQGLDWDAIRREYKAKATPEELDGPFDEAGNLKGSAAARLAEAAVLRQQRANERAEKAKLPKGHGGSPEGRAKGGKASSPSTKTPQPTRDALATLYREGVSMKAAAERLGVHPSTARDVLIQDGVHVPEDRLRTAG